MNQVFCDRSGQQFNEFVPVDFVLGPYVRDLQANAEAHCDHSYNKGERMRTAPCTPE